MLLYYITDRTQFPGNEPARRRLLLLKLAEAAEAGVDLIQLREKDLSASELESLAQAARKVVRERSPTTRLLINGRVDLAIACSLDGVHLPANDIPVAAAKRAFAGRGAPAILGVSCHSRAEVARAREQGASFAVFGAVFGKPAGGLAAAGVAALAEACTPGLPVLALGGVTLENASSCLQAGAAGVAGIRLFQQAGVAEVVRKLRAKPDRR